MDSRIVLDCSPGPGGGGAGAQGQIQAGQDETRPEGGQATW